MYLIRDKSEVTTCLKQFFILIQTQYHKTIKIIRSDNGTEFLNNPLRQFYHDMGVLVQTSCVGTPQQNGRVERKHRHILNVARSLMFQASLPVEFWGECVRTAVYLINRTPSRVLGGKSPFEMLNTTPPDIPLACFRVYLFYPQYPTSTQQIRPSQYKMYVPRLSFRDERLAGIRFGNSSLLSYA